MTGTNSTTCRKCGESKPTSLFSIVKKTGKVNPYCKACRSKLSSDYAAKNSEKKQQYNKEYRAKNSERLREYDRERSKDPMRRAALNQSTAKWAKAHPEKRRIIERRHYMANRGSILAKIRAARVRVPRKTSYTAVGKICAACGLEKPLIEFPKRSDQKDKARWCCSSCYTEKNKPWRSKNKTIIRASDLKTRSRRAGAQGAHTGKDIQQLLILQRGHCACCRVKLTKYHVDHITALSRGGSNDRLNLQLLCPRCNLRKSAKHPIDFMRENGFLL